MHYLSHALNPSLLSFACQHSFDKQDVSCWLKLNCCHGAGSLDEAREQLTAVTSDQSSLADQVAAALPQLNSLTQQRDRAEIKSAELSEQLDSAAEQLRGSELMCSELQKEVEALNETHAHQRNTSESRHAELSEQLEETRAAHARLESEYELLTQQMSGDGAKGSPQSAGSSPQRKAQALLEELEDYRYELQWLTSFFCAPALRCNVGLCNCIVVFCNVTKVVDIEQRPLQMCVQACCFCVSADLCHYMKLYWQQVRPLRGLGGRVCSLPHNT